MQEVAFRTKLKPGSEADYDREHAVIPADLDVALREAGVQSWKIWRDGLDLFHVVEVEDYAHMRAHLENHPANIPWQEKINQFLAVADDYSEGSGTIPQVWALPS